MIITDQLPDSPVKDSRAFQELNGGQPSPTAPPPPYQTIPPRPPPPPPPSLPRPVTAITIRGSRTSPEARFFKALAVAALIWFLVGMFTRSIFYLAHSHHRTYQIGWNDESDVAWPKPSDGNISRCVGRDEWSTNNFPGLSYPYYSETSFNLPASSELLFLLARGALSSGVVSVVDAPADSDVVTVVVVVQHYVGGALDKVNVCLLYHTNGKEGDGVGIFTPNYGSWSLTDRLMFDVTVHLPASSGSSPRLITNFETNLPHFHHKVGDLQGVVDFKSLSLKATDMPIEVESLSAEYAKIQTTNSPIVGTLNASTHLSLKTSNAIIKVDVGLINDQPAKATELDLKSSNGAITSAISLLTSHSSGGSYRVVAATSNSPLDITYPTQPLDSILRFDGRTTNSPANVALDPAFEGSFSLTSSVVSPYLDQSHTRDPAGRGRRRTVDQRRVGGTLDGSIWWEYPKKETGWAKLRTSNGAAHLQL